MRVTTAMAAYRMIAGSAVSQPVANNDGSSTAIAIELALRMRPHPIVMALRAIVLDDIERAILTEVFAGTLVAKRYIDFFNFGQGLVVMIGCLDHHLGVVSAARWDVCGGSGRGMSLADKIGEGVRLHIRQIST